MMTTSEAITYGIGEGYWENDLEAAMELTPWIEWDFDRMEKVFSIIDNEFNTRARTGTLPVITFEENR